MAVLAFAGGVAFWWCFSGLDKEERSLNEIAVGEHNAEVAHQKKVDNVA